MRSISSIQNIQEYEGNDDDYVEENQPMYDKDVLNAFNIQDGCVFEVSGSDTWTIIDSMVEEANPMFEEF